MKHARKDYNKRIQDSEGIIPDDEPVFLLRAQDACAPRVVMFWAALVRDNDPDLAEHVERHARDMEDWQRTKAIKRPDTPAELRED